MVSKNIIVTLLVTAAAAAPETGAAQNAAYNSPGAGNPILPGYLPTQPSRSLVIPIIYMLLLTVAEPVSDRHNSGAARISRTGL